MKSCGYSCRRAGMMQIRRFQRTMRNLMGAVYFCPPPAAARLWPAGQGGQEMQGRRVANAYLATPIWR